MACTPLVHPMWYYYENEKFFAVSNRDGVKVRSLKNNPDVYFLVDIVDKVRGKGKAKVIDDPEYATKITTHHARRYLGSTDSPEAKSGIEVAKSYYSAIEITPLFMATWKA